MLLKDYLPPNLTSTDIFKAILSQEQLEVDGINNSIRGIIDQCFVDTATWGLDYWESFLGIVTDHAKDEAYRRTVIKAKIRGSGTVTVQLIENVANSFANGSVAVIEHSTIYSFEIKFTSAKGIPPNLLDLQNAIEQIKPAHLAVTYTFTYNTNAMLSAYTHDQLSVYTHDQLKTI